MSLKGFFKRLSCGLLKMNCRVWSKLYFGALLSVLLTGVKSTIYYSSLQMSVIMQLSGLPQYWSLLSTYGSCHSSVCLFHTDSTTMYTLVVKLQSSLVVCIILLRLLCTLVIGHTACAEQI